MLLNVKDRRNFQDLTVVVDDALNIADNFGWRYALAYLVVQRVPCEIIQRLLSDGGRARKPRSQLIFSERKNYGCKGHYVDEIERLFDALQKRNPAERCVTSNPPPASRSSLRLTDED